MGVVVSGWAYPKPTPFHDDDNIKHHMKSLDASHQSIPRHSLHSDLGAKPLHTVGTTLEIPGI